MPNDTPGDKLEWTEDNLSAIISRLTTEASSDRSAHDRLMTSPFDALSALIDVPEEYRTMTVAKQPTAKLLVINVPAFGARSEALPSGTTDAISSKNFEVVCTIDPQW